jgi:hypothetical protein
MDVIKSFPCELLSQGRSYLPVLMQSLQLQEKGQERLCLKSAGERGKRKCGPFP